MYLSYSRKDIVLSDLSFEVKSGEKIAIIGRTGSGKTTILYSLLRMIELIKDKGKILIDNIDISKVKIRDLRKAISVIPVKF